MTPERWEKVKALFDAALGKEPPERQRFLESACADDELRSEVEHILADHDDAGSFLEGPPSELVIAAKALGISQAMSQESHDSAHAIVSDGAFASDATTATLRELSLAQLHGANFAARESRRLGHYEILRRLGQGGMGTVYLGRRADEAFNKTVAIKILRSEANADILRRFHRERELLAGLDHPNIARLLDGGETGDGLPYFVMEYVEGHPVTQYADDERLPISARIGLFRQICDAVDYAHQRNIIHRDLKPGNILVTVDGRVKLLDFGIARLLDADGAGAALTNTGAWLMTPEYASPEQVRGEVVLHTSDVYSLGVILFELLTGHRPYHLRSRVFHEIVRVVCEQTPTPPSAVVLQPIETTTAAGNSSTLPPETAAMLRQMSLSQLQRELTGDLDNILLKALDKRPQNRYASALQFRADVDRHVNGEPVWARSRSRAYRMGRVLSRYRMPLFVAAIMAGAVATGTVSLRWSALWWVTCGLALIGIWRAATDPTIGRKLAESRVTEFGLVILLAGNGFLALYSPRSVRMIVLAINIVLAVAAISLLAAWLYRRHWTGPLLLNIGQSLEAQRIILLLASINTTAQTLRLFSRTMRSYMPLELSDFAFVLWSLAVLALLGASARQEIRRDGFINRGRLIRWSRIIKWVWEDVDSTPGPITAPFSKPQREPVLLLYLHHPVKFLPPVRLRIARAQRKEVEAILARQLGVWPDRV